MSIEAASLMDAFLAHGRQTEEEGVEESPAWGVDELEQLRGLDCCPECSTPSSDMYVDAAVTSPAFRDFLEATGVSEDVVHHGVDLRLACRKLMHCFRDHAWTSERLAFMAFRMEDACCSHLALAAIFNPNCPIERVLAVLPHVTREHLDVMNVDPDRLSSRLQEAMESLSSLQRPRVLLRGDGGPVRKATLRHPEEPTSSYLVSTWSQGGDSVFRVNSTSSTASINVTDNSTGTYYSAPPCAPFALRHPRAGAHGVTRPTNPRKCELRLGKKSCIDPDDKRRRRG